MDLNKKPLPMSTLFGIRSRIDTNPDYQRPAVWSTAQKRLLVDTILRGYDVPKIYLRKTGNSPEMYEVVDGQQRIRAIWEFMNGEFDLGKNADCIGDTDMSLMKYESSDKRPGLPDEMRVSFDTYSLHIVILSDTDDDEVREMFLRLQNGTTLKAQEKRNALSGNMRDFVKEMSMHPLFSHRGFSNTRFTFDLICAQMVCTELAGGGRSSGMNAFAVSPTVEIVMYRPEGLIESFSIGTRFIQ